MAYELREGSGSLFRNGDKKQEKHPDYRGDAMIGGAVYKIAGWIKETRGGDKFLSLSFQPKEGEQQPGGAAPPAGAAPHGHVPF